MTINVGDKLPHATFMELTQDGPAPVDSEEIFAGKKVVLFAVPGAFTPTCHHQHLPGFINNAQSLRDKGVDTIACVSVNDPYVMGAWAIATDAGDEIRFLSDPRAEFTTALGMDTDSSVVGLGIRSRRYAMLVDDGEVRILNIEPKRGQAIDSSAEEMLKAL